MTKKKKITEEDVKGLMALLKKIKEKKWYIIVSVGLLYTGLKIFKVAIPEWLDIGEFVIGFFKLLGL